MKLNGIKLSEIITQVPDREERMNHREVLDACDLPKCTGQGTQACVYHNLGISYQSPSAGWVLEGQKCCEACKVWNLSGREYAHYEHIEHAQHIEHATTD